MKVHPASPHKSLGLRPGFQHSLVAAAFVLLLALIVAPFAHGADPGGTFKIHPRATFLRTDNTDVANGNTNGTPVLDTTPISLASIGLHPGDYIRLHPVGTFGFVPDEDEVHKLTTAVFSATNTLLAHGQLHRVPGAINAGQPDDSGTTYYEGLATDIPEDFTFGDNDGVVQIPAGSQYLFVAVRDILYSDNHDDDADFYVQISIWQPQIVQQPDPDEAVDDNGNIWLQVAADWLAFPYQYTYQWQRRASSVAPYVDIAGATDATLFLRGIHAADAGEYRAVVTNLNGSTASDASEVVIRNLRDALDTPSLAWRTRGSALWVAETTDTHDGVDALKQGPLDWEWGTLDTIVSTPGQLTFWLKMNGGHVDLWTNGDYQSYSTPAGQWVQHTVLLPNNWEQWVTFTLQQEDDGASVVLDQVQFTPISQLPPIITEQPDSAWADTGARVEFSVEVVEGGGPATFQWQKKVGAGSFLDIPGAIVDELVIASAQAADAAEYRVVVTNAHGSTTSGSGTLTLVNLKTALDSPLNWWVQGDLPWVAQSAVTHDGVDALAWQGDDTGDIRTYLPESGILSFWMRSFGAVLQVETDDDEQTYQPTGGAWVQQFVTVTGGAQDVDFDFLGNDNGTDGAWIDQVVFTPASQLPPTFTENPDSAWADPGARVEFSVELLDGGGPYAYQWQKKVGAGSFANISGATGSELVIENAQAGDVAEYRAVVTNPRGTATSESRALTLVSLKTALDSPLSWWVQGDLPWVAQSTVTHDGVSAIAWQGNDTGDLRTYLPGSGVLSFWMRTIGANLDVEWDDDEPSFGPTNGAWVQQFITISGGAQNVDFDFHGSDNGTDGAWIDQVVFTPASQLPPVIEDQPDFAWADAGARVEFSVQPLDNGGPYTYQWQKKVGAGSFADISGATGDELVIANAQAGDVATYRVVVTNSHGSTTSAERTLTLVNLKTALDSPLSWWVQGDLPWVAQSTVTHDGVDAIAWQGEDTGDLRTQLPGSGVLSFWMRSIGANLEVETDHDEPSFDSTFGVWVQQFITVYGGAQDVDFDFHGGDNGNDGAWIDQVVFTPAAQLPPILSGQPFSIGVEQGSWAEFSATADSESGATTWQWQHKVGGTFTNISGATSATLRVNNVQTGDLGDYRVIATNSHGPTTSNVAQLSIVNFRPALGTPSVEWWTVGHALWAPQSLISLDGSALRSGDIDDNQWSELDGEIPAPGILRFSWRVSSEERFDFLRVYIDNTQIAAISGETGWTQVTVPIGGAATVRFVYDKDGSDSDGEDAGFIDQVSFAAPATYAEWASLYFTASELQNTAISGFQADADLDGISNGVEAALGTNPRVAQTGASPFTLATTGAGATGHVVLAFDIASSQLPGLKVEVQESPSLAANSWTTVATKTGASSWSGPAAVQTTTLPGGGVHVEVQSVATLNGPAGFLRLKVSQAP